MECPFQRRQGCGRDPGENFLNLGISLIETIFKRGTQKKLAKFRKKFLTSDKMTTLLKNSKDIATWLEQGRVEEPAPYNSGKRCCQE